MLLLISIIPPTLQYNYFCRKVGLLVWIFGLKRKKASIFKNHHA